MGQFSLHSREEQLFPPSYHDFFVPSKIAYFLSPIFTYFVLIIVVKKQIRVEFVKLMFLTERKGEKSPIRVGLHFA